MQRKPKRLNLPQEARKVSFRWPQEGDEPTMAFDPEELMVLLGGVRVELKLKRKDVFERRF